MLITELRGPDELGFSATPLISMRRVLLHSTLLLAPTCTHVCNNSGIVGHATAAYVRAVSPVTQIDVLILTSAEDL